MLNIVSSRYIAIKTQILYNKTILLTIMKIKSLIFSLFVAVMLVSVGCDNGKPYKKSTKE